ncbi:collagen alpha-1(I) chain-like [Sarcophilus harrisii]|uniref:collagen alpha-1(I) chain-like n=1 Tax=Sarcophilus harrisii TaxID=9305 RepID=UPI001301F2DF|nr:collagen alpha-1(I) chain-like [Sarcophilus harrisii]
MGVTLVASGSEQVVSLDPQMHTRSHQHGIPPLDAAIADPGPSVCPPQHVAPPLHSFWGTKGQGGLCSTGLASLPKRDVRNQGMAVSSCRSSGGPQNMPGWTLGDPENIESFGVTVSRLSREKGPRWSTRPSPPSYRTNPGFLTPGLAHSRRRIDARVRDAEAAREPRALRGGSAGLRPGWRSGRRRGGGTAAREPSGSGPRRRGRQAGFPENSQKEQLLSADCMPGAGLGGGADGDGGSGGIRTRVLRSSEVRFRPRSAPPLPPPHPPGERPITPDRETEARPLAVRSRGKRFDMRRSSGPEARGADIPPGTRGGGRRRGQSAARTGARRVGRGANSAPRPPAPVGGSRAPPRRLSRPRRRGPGPGPGGAGARVRGRSGASPSDPGRVLRAAHSPLGRGEFHNHSGRERRRGAKNPGSGESGARMRARRAPSQTHTHFPRTWKVTQSRPKCSSKRASLQAGEGAGGGRRLPARSEAGARGGARCPGARRAGAGEGGGECQARRCRRSGPPRPPRAPRGQVLADAGSPPPPRGGRPPGPRPRRRRGQGRQGPLPETLPAGGPGRGAVRAASAGPRGRGWRPGARPSWRREVCLRPAARAGGSAPRFLSRAGAGWARDRGGGESWGAGPGPEPGRAGQGRGTARGRGGAGREGPPRAGAGVGPGRRGGGRARAQRRPVIFTRWHVQNAQLIAAGGQKFRFPLGAAGPGGPRPVAARPPAGASSGPGAREEGRTPGRARRVRADGCPRAGKLRAGEQVDAPSITAARPLRGPRGDNNRGSGRRAGADPGPPPPGQREAAAARAPGGKSSPRSGRVWPVGPTGRGPAAALPGPPRRSPPSRPGGPAGAGSAPHVLEASGAGPGSARPRAGPLPFPGRSLPPPRAPPHRRPGRVCGERG